MFDIICDAVSPYGFESIKKNDSTCTLRIRFISPESGSNILCAFRKAIIETNLTSNVPNVIKGEFTSKNIYKNNFKVKKPYFKSELLESTALLTAKVAIILLGLSIVYLVVDKWLRISDNVGKRFDVFIHEACTYGIKWTKSHFVGSCALMIFTATKVTRYAVRMTKTIIKNSSIAKKYENYSYYELKMVAVDSIMAKVDFKNIVDPDEDGFYEDPITLEPIAKENLRAPRVFLFDKRPILITSMLTSMFTTQMKLNPGEIPHPFLSSALKEEAKTKFLKDMGNFFNVPEAGILDIWNTSGQEYLEYVEDHAQMALGKVWDTIERPDQVTIIRILQKALTAQFRVLKFQRIFNNETITAPFSNLIKECQNSGLVDEEIVKVFILAYPAKFRKIVNDIYPGYFA